MKPFSPDTRRSQLAALALLLGAHAAPAAGIINPDYDHRFDQTVTVSAAGFTHPGILHSRADLNLIRDKVQAGAQPWTRAFEAFRRDPHSLLSYKMTGPDADLGSVEDGYRMIADGGAAYNLAIMWYVTGDPAFAAKAIGILNAWSATAKTNATDRIRHGIAALRFIAAAEILRSTPSSGWKPADIERFTGLARKFEPAIDIKDGFMNQGGYAAMGSMAVAVFLDDPAYYKRIVRRITVGDNPNPLREIAITHQIYPTGQVMEMGRDQPHAAEDVVTLALMAQTMFIQGPKISDGIDLFAYLGQRLRLGAEYYTKFNLGYDVEWSPQNAAGTGKGAFARISDSGRGSMPAYDLIYNHYRYVMGVPDSGLTYTKAIRDLVLEREATDFPGYGALLFTNAKALEATPLAGPPQAIEVGFIDPRFQRFSAGDYTEVHPRCYHEYFTDADGTRPFLSGAQHGDWVKYKDFDFGPTPVDKFYISSGNNSTVGNKIDIHLDSLEGPIIGTADIPATGWYTRFRTGVAALTKPLTGRHTIVLQQHGSNNVYKLEGSLDWLKVARGSAHFPNAAATNDGTSGTKPVDDGAGGRALAFQDGGGILYRDMDFDNGSLTLGLRGATTGAGELQLRRGSATGPVLATYPLPDTRGAWQDVSLPQVRGTIYGRNDVAFVYKGAGTLQLATFQYGPGLPPSPLVDGASYRGVSRGKASRETAKDGTTFAKIDAGTTLAYRSIGAGPEPRRFAIRVASNAAGTITLRDKNATSDPLATLAVPDTGGKWTWLDIQVPAGRPNSGGMTFLTFSSALQLASFQFDPPNFVAGG